jgi:hypothetical protein
MLDRTAQLEEVRHGDWSRDQLEAMNSKFCEVMEAAFASGRESRAAASAVVRVRPRMTEEEAIETVWRWFCRHTDEEDIAFVEVVARVQILLPSVTAARVEAGFRRRFETRFKRMRA